MKVTDSLMTMLGDFAAMKRTPDYTPSTVVEPEIPRKHSAPETQAQSQRRHSLMISVGTEEIPRLGRTRTRSESVATPQCIEAKLYNKGVRRCSAPCVSTTATTASSLRKKLQKMREEKSSDSESDLLKEEEDEEAHAVLAQRRASSGSAVYRI
ncbi:hypothetical protein RB195_016376 [Necator americanus]|uniref:Uncharacterized protein n=1 Tax=Necator americanus TaxID=51031 RepID=A0ABR1E918_NECAM